MGVIDKTNLQINTKTRNEFVDITDEIKEIVKKNKVNDGCILLYVPHTTAGVTINENYDPSVKKDIIKKLSELVPYGADYSHAEGNADSHIKSSIIGSSQFIPISNGSLGLGRWQGIFFCEFDGPRTRRLVVELFD